MPFLIGFLAMLPFPLPSLGFPSATVAIVGTPVLLLGARKMRLTALESDTMECLVDRAMLAVEVDVRWAALVLDMRELDVLALGRRVEDMWRSSSVDGDSESSSGGLTMPMASINYRWRPGARAQNCDQLTSKAFSFQTGVKWTLVRIPTAIYQVSFE